MSRITYNNTRSIARQCAFDMPSLCGNRRQGDLCPILILTDASPFRDARSAVSLHSLAFYYISKVCARKLFRRERTLPAAGQHLEPRHKRTKGTTDQQPRTMAGR